MTKEKEIHNLREIIAQVPRDSYLADMLRHIAVQFESDIRSDFITLPDLGEIERVKWEAIATQRQILADNAKLKAQNEELAVKAAQYTRHINEAKDKLRSVAQVIIDACNR